MKIFRRATEPRVLHTASIVAGIAAIALVLYLFGLLSAQVEVLKAALGDEQSATEARGEEPVSPDADELLDDLDYAGPQGPQGEPGPGPSDAQVYAAVAAYLVDNPVTAEGPSSAEIATAVANYLSEYPPGPTPAQVAAAVAEYLTANPPAAGAAGANGTDGADGAAGVDGAPGPPGPEGPQGETGPPPSAEDVAAAVQEWMDANPFPDCEGGTWEPYTVVTTAGPIDTVLCVAS